MRRTHPIVILVILAGLGAATAWLSATQNRPQPTREDRIPALTKLVAEQEQESALAVMEYRPRCRASIDDLSLPVVDLLRQLPGVAEVELKRAAPGTPPTALFICGTGISSRNPSTLSTRRA